MRKGLIKGFNQYLRENVNGSDNEELDTELVSDEGDFDLDSEQLSDDSEEEEDEEEYIGEKLMRELGEALGVEVVDNKINFKGKVVNFFSETENFHIGKQKFATVEQVVDFLNSGQTQAQAQTQAQKESLRFRNRF